MSARTVVHLRDPEEAVEVIQDSDGWVTFRTGTIGGRESVVTLISKDEGRLRTIPWSRIVDIDTLEGGVFAGVEEPHGHPKKRKKR